MYDKLTIFYFTGTGNALAAAKWIASVAIEQNMNTEIIKITPSSKFSKRNFSEKSLIGFCYPTHGFNAPPVVIGARNWISPAAELEKDYYPQTEWIIDAVHERVLPLPGHQERLLGNILTTLQITGIRECY